MWTFFIVPFILPDIFHSRALFPSVSDSCVQMPRNNCAVALELFDKKFSHILYHFSLTVNKKCQSSSRIKNMASRSFKPTDVKCYITKFVIWLLSRVLHGVTETKLKFLSCFSFNIRINFDPLENRKTFPGNEFSTLIKKGFNRW